MLEWVVNVNIINTGGRGKGSVAETGLIKI